MLVPNAGSVGSAFDKNPSGGGSQRTTVKPVCSCTAVQCFGSRAEVGTVTTLLPFATSATVGADGFDAVAAGVDAAEPDEASRTLCLARTAVVVTETDSVPAALLQCSHLHLAVKRQGF